MTRAAGLVTGLVVDVGDGVSHIIPVVEGCAFPHLTKRLDIAGRDITARMVDLLQACSLSPLSRISKHIPVPVAGADDSYYPLQKWNDELASMHLFLPAQCAAKLTTCEASAREGVPDQCTVLLLAAAGARVQAPSRL